MNVTRPTPKYFIMDFGTKKFAYVSEVLPEGKTPTFHLSVKLRSCDNDTIEVVALHELGKPHVFSANLSKNYTYLYKSNLQKCIRRRLSEKAVRTAYAFLSGDQNTFLRRLPIIAMEDVLPHPSIINVVWWMMATSKIGDSYKNGVLEKRLLRYPLSTKEVFYLLGIVYLLTEIQEYEFAKFNGDPSHLNWEKFPSPKRDLLWAMEFRKSYGGMSCDIAMIGYLQTAWYKRFQNENTVWESLCRFRVPAIERSSLGVCDKRDIILPAIDYHCYSWMPKKIRKHYPQYSEYEIKGAIWFFKSRINVRRICQGSSEIKPPPDNLEDVYQDIEKDVEKLAKWIHTQIVEDNIIT